ncbi:MAG: 2-hydroxyacyl-CoA dehydratase family protein [Pseudomonadota bacterium]
MEEILDKLMGVAESPYREVKAWKDKGGKKVIGHFLTDVPEELIHAAGFLPASIIGSNEKVSKAESYVQDFACSLVKSTLELALNGDLDFLDGVIVPHICDSTRSFPLIWEIHASPPFFDYLRFPKKMTDPRARGYLVKELGRLRGELERLSGADVSDDTLRNSIRLYNSNRELLRTIYDLRKETPALLSAFQVFSIIKSSMFLPKEEHNDLLSRLIPELEAAKEQKPVHDGRIKLFLSGKLWEPPQILDVIEGIGALIVGDDLFIGSRYINKDVSLDGDPIEALADRQINMIPFGGFFYPQNERLTFLLEMVRKNRADGVIFLHSKFCETLSYDYPDLKKQLEVEGIPSLMLETELQTTSLEQARTRLQAFAEMLGGN